MQVCFTMYAPYNLRFFLVYGVYGNDHMILEIKTIGLYKLYTNATAL